MNEITFYTELYNKIGSGLNLNYWHPLYKYIVEVKWRFRWINNTKYEGLSNRFSDCLECIKNFGSFEDTEALLKSVLESGESVTLMLRTTA